VSLPQYARGALASVKQSTLTDVVLFQYNPETIRRTLSPQWVGRDKNDPGAGSPDLSFSDAAKQNITFTAHFDALDALQRGDTDAQQYGIAPQLAVLEKLMNPAVADVSTAESDASGGKMVIVAIKAPGTILVWGSRVLPVRITSVVVEEEQFDAALNPVRANAAITVDVQTYGDRKPSDLDYGRFKAYHTKLEQLASRGAASQEALSALVNSLNR
jgi:Contractile injection system tube protein